MRIGLRARLLLTTGAVVAAALAASALISIHVMRIEMTHIAQRPRPARVDAAEVARAFAVGREALRVLRDRIAPGQEIVLVDAQGRLLLTTATRPMRTSRTPNGALEVDVDAGGGRRGRMVFAGSEIPVAGGGYAYIVPMVRGLDPLGSAKRSFILIVGIVGLLALGVTALVARSIVRPIEQLTVAMAGDAPTPVDVTSNDEVGALARSFNAMVARVAATEELRRNVVNDVAHELRTPLTSLRCALESIEDGLREPDARTIAALAKDVALLQRLVDDLQMIAVAEARQLPLHRRMLVLREEVERALATAGVTAAIEVADDVEIDADPDRLQQILINLLRNAATAGGSIRVVGTRDAIEAHDTGIGIPAAALPHIFDRFYRVDASRQRATGGAGLGLAIVKTLVDAHGWRIEVASEEGRGTVFGIRMA